MEKSFCKSGSEGKVLLYLGINFLYSVFFRYILITYRDNLFEIVKRLDPESLERRTKDLNRKKGEYVVPGPDYIWSLDGHEKLHKFGFEIYAAIDAYSRKIMWIYVGISNRTPQSVLRQYLEAITLKGYQPFIVRTDRGKETDLAAEVHFYLARTARANPNIRIENCWFWGTSTGNQRIESWWSQLQKSCLYKWRVSLARITVVRR